MNLSDAAEKKLSPENQSPRRPGGRDEDESDLLDYCRILWKRKWLIVLGTALPTLCAAVFFNRQAPSHQISFVYNQSLNAKEFRVLTDTFYSQENITILIHHLQADGLSEYANRIKSADTRKKLENLIHFEIPPSFFENSDSKYDYEEWKKLQPVDDTLLIMNIYGQSPVQIRDVADSCREIFEQQTPLFLIKNSLNSKFHEINENIAQIEETQYTLTLNLNRKKFVWAQLKNLKSAQNGTLSDTIILQFENIENTSDFLPLPYQIQAAEMQVIKLQEQLQKMQEQYACWTELLDLYTTLYAHVTTVDLSSYTLSEYLAYLQELMRKYESAESAAKNSLAAYTKHIQNQMIIARPFIEQPKVYQLENRNIGKTGIIFCAAGIFMVIVASLYEGAPKTSDGKTPAG